MDIFILSVTSMHGNIKQIKSRIKFTKTITQLLNDLDIINFFNLYRAARYRENVSVYYSKQERNYITNKLHR